MKRLFIILLILISSVSFAATPISISNNTGMRTDMSNASKTASLSINNIYASGSAVIDVVAQTQ